MPDEPEKLLGLNGTHEVFLKFLPHTADEAYVRQHFEGGGVSGQGDYKVSSLKGVRLAMDKASGECRGTGWLSLGDEAEAAWLVEEWNVHPYNHMDGKHVEITHARPTGNWIQRTKSDIQCRYGRLCVRADCTFRHPDGWDAETNAKKGGQMGDAFATSRIVCRNGRHCNRSDCFFAHPEGRVYDGTAKKEEEPKPAKKKKSPEDEEAARAIREDFEGRVATKPAKKKSLGDEEAARAIREDFEGPATADNPPREKKKPRKEVLVEEPVAQRKDKASLDSACEAKGDPDAESVPKKKKKTKSPVAAQVDAEDDGAQVSVEPGVPAKKKNKDSVEPVAQDIGDLAAPAKKKKKKRSTVALEKRAEAKKQRKRAASWQEGWSDTKQNKKQKG